MSVTAFSVLFSGAAFAAEPNPYTIDQINKVLESRGERPLYGSRVVHDEPLREIKNVDRVQPSAGPDLNTRTVTTTAR